MEMVMKMMIVDDSTVIRRKIERSQQMFKPEQILQANSGRHALELFKKESPELITMDLTMPQMDGVECVKKLMLLDKSVRILVVSALTDKSTALAAIKHGARGFLAKPFNDEQLNQALKSLTK
jgi:two-component system, chemotaxis family, chemotaxis protein CheY